METAQLLVTQPLHLLQALAPADVLHQHLQSTGLMTPGQKRVELHPDRCATLGAQTELARVVLKLLQVQPFEKLGALGLVFRHDQLQHAAPVNVLGFVAQQPAEMLVDLEHAARGDIQLEHAHGGLLAHGMKARVALLACLRTELEAPAPAPATLPPARNPGGQHQPRQQAGSQHQPWQVSLKPSLAAERGLELQRPDTVVHLYLSLQRLDRGKLRMGFRLRPQGAGEQDLRAAGKQRQRQGRPFVVHADLGQWVGGAEVHQLESDLRIKIGRNQPSGKFTEPDPGIDRSKQLLGAVVAPFLGSSGP